MKDTHPEAIEQVETGCIVVGGGPAGMMLGFLLARAGIDIVVLEKHADFLRDFRGDTLHPSTMEIMHELGLLDELLRLPHQQAERLAVIIDGQPFAGPDFTHLPTRAKFVALMPQWDFLNFLLRHARRYPAFQLRMRTEAVELLEESGRVVGVRAHGPDGTLELRAPLVVGTDGRHSTVRTSSGLPLVDHGVPIDVLWFRVPKDDETSAEQTTPVLGRIQGDQLLVMLDRGDYYQCGYLIRKGQFDEIKALGLEAFRANTAQLAPPLARTIGAIDDWDKVKLLTVQVNRLTRWYRLGLLCIGDAAHAMSPAGGVGINLAIQDAVATANLLAEPLRQGQVTENDLRRVQQRRELPVRVIQALQVAIHRRMFGRPGHSPLFQMPWPEAKLLKLFAPLLRRVAARLIGIGIRAEHVAPSASSRNSVSRMERSGVEHAAAGD